MKIFKKSQVAGSECEIKIMLQMNVEVICFTSK